MDSAPRRAFTPRGASDGARDVAPAGAFAEFCRAMKEEAS
jgi:hypothetical protein